MLGFIFIWDALIGSALISEDFVLKKLVERYALYAFSGAFGLFFLLILTWFIKLYVNVKYFDHKSMKQYFKCRKEKKKFSKVLNGI